MEELLAEACAILKARGIREQCPPRNMAVGRVMTERADMRSYNALCDMRSYNALIQGAEVGCEGCAGSIRWLAPLRPP